MCILPIFRRVDSAWESRMDSPVALGLAVAEFLAAKAQGNRRETYLRSLACYLGMFVRTLGEVRPVNTITGKTLDQWFELRGEKPATRRGNLGRISSFFAFCERRDYVLVSPARKCERVIVEWQTPRIFNPAQARRLMLTARRINRWSVAYFALGLYSGIRPDELRRLRWRDVGLDRGFVTVDAATSKTRRRRLVPLHEKCVRWLRTCSQVSEFICPLTPKQIQLIRRKSGVPWSQDILRHSAASYLLALHGDAGRVARWLGNSETILLRHYHELVDPRDARRFWMVRKQG